MSCHVKNPHEDQVYVYDALTLEEYHVIVVTSSVCAGYIDQVTMTNFESISAYLVSHNKLD